MAAGTTLPAIPTGYETELRNIERRRAFADALRAQSITPEQSNAQLSIASPLSKIAQALIAKDIEKRADSRYNNVSTQRKAALAEAVGGFQRLLSDPNTTPDQVISAYGTNPEPVIQALVKPYIEAQGKKMENDVTFDGTPVDVIGPDGKLVSVLVNKGGGTKPLPGVRALPGIVSGQALNDSRTGLPIRQLPADPDAVAIRADPQPGETLGPIVPNPAAISSRGAVALAGRPMTQVIMPSESAYSKTVGEGVAKADLAVIEAARGAPKQIREASRILEILKKAPTTGSFADQRLAINKALATVGIIDPSQVADTEVLRTTLVQMTLANVRAANLGAGNGFSNTDRDFVERATGQLNMTSESLARLARIAIKTAKAAQARGLEVERRMGGVPGVGPSISNGASMTPYSPTPSQQRAYDKYK